LGNSNVRLNRASGTRIRASIFDHFIRILTKQFLEMELVDFAVWKSSTTITRIDDAACIESSQSRSVHCGEGNGILAFLSEDVSTVSDRYIY